MSVNKVPDIAWDHCTLLGGKNRKVKCNYCGKGVTGTNRLKYHLACIRGDVMPCERVPLQVKTLMETSILERLRQRLTSEIGPEDQNFPWSRDLRKLYDKLQSKSEESKATKSTTNKKGKVDIENKLKRKMEIFNPVSLALQGSDDKWRHACRSIGRFFFESGVEISASESPAFQSMIDAIISCGFGFKSPSASELRGWILKEEVREVNERLKEVLLDDAKSITRFIYNKAQVLKMTRLHTKGRELVQPAKTGIVGCFLTLQMDFFSDAEVSSGLIECIDQMIMDLHLQDMVLQQLEEYKAAKDGFAEGMVISQRNECLPAEWWSSCGGHCPNLQRVAIRILSQTCTTSKCKLDWSLMRQLHSGKRNRIEQQRLADLVSVHYNLQLNNIKSPLRSYRPTTEMELNQMSDWLVGFQDHGETSNWMDLEFEETEVADKACDQGLPIFQPKEELDLEDYKNQGVS
ncbi:hypothetical protein AMTR_s00025p00224940 [Amborella trichopoda]|uniref:BED-type domain-containing protein n=1 Tax=Amborella trichopoda TaxID=13333 RepID=W1PRE6_AMBTC|nr:hypothetical protein AMTR_s00025p00224940 [Amborella trichopoda]